MSRITIALSAVFLFSASLFAQSRTAADGHSRKETVTNLQPSKQSFDGLMQYTLLERLIAIIKHFEGWHDSSKYPYVGWGHRVQPGEKLPRNITRAHADSLLYEDLYKLINHFKKYGSEYTLLLVAVAYNCGAQKIEGGGKYKPSRLIQKIKQGRKDIEEDYLDFCRWKGKVVPSIKRRRWAEFQYLYEGNSF